MLGQKDKNANTSKFMQIRKRDRVMKKITAQVTSLIEHELEIELPKATAEALKNRYSDDLQDRFEYYHAYSDLQETISNKLKQHGRSLHKIKSFQETARHDEYTEYKKAMEEYLAREKERRERGTLEYNIRPEAPNEEALE